MPEVIVMPADECWRRVAENVVGRLGFATADGPRIFPVNYSCDGRDILVRVREGSEMAGAAAIGSAGEGAAAFEIDHVDHERHQGWSVLLVGRLAVGTSPREPQHGSAAPHPWALGQRTILLRLRPDRISGRRLGADWRGRDPVRRRL